MTLRHALGALYANGCDVDFRALHPEGRCISLPAYPWQRQRYWLPAADDGDASAFAPKAAERRNFPHALLDRHTPPAEPTAPLLFELDVSGRSHGIVRDHSIEGSLVFNSLAYVEMVLAAAREAFGHDRFSVNDVELRRRLVVPEDGARTIQLSIGSDEARGRRFAVYSRARGGQAEWTEHVVGRLAASPPEVPEPLAASERDAIRSRCPGRLAGDDFYESLRKVGMHFGARFHGLTQVHRAAGEAAGDVAISEVVRAELAEYLFHPGLLDSCGQVMVAAANGEHPFMPTRLDRVRILRKPEGPLFAHARLRPGSPPGSITGDIVAYDEAGRPVAEIAGARLTWLDRIGRAAPSSRERLYRVEWQPHEPPTAAHGGRAGTWLVLADEAGVGEAFASERTARGDTCVCVTRGDDYARLARRRFRVRRDQPEDVARVIGDVTREDTLTGVAHFFSLDAPSPLGMTASQVAGCFRLGPGTAAAVVRALVAAHQTAPIWLVTRGAQALPGDGTPVAVGQSAMWGFGRALAAEHPDLWGGLVDLDAATTTPAALAAALNRSLDAGDAEDEVALRAGERYVPRLVRYAAIAAEAPAARRDATYLVTGGFGGLGLRAARWLIEKGASRVVLLGRTPLPPRERWGAVDAATDTGARIAAILELEAMGAAVHTAFVDVSDDGQLRRFFARFARERWPAIRGVIHAAGIGELAPIAELDGESLRRDIAAKAVGAWALGKLLEDAPLDFFVLYSSLSAVLPSPLLAGYASANAFLDGFAQWRHGRGLPALSIGWGAFSEVGMAARAARASSGVAHGIGAFTPEDGLKLQGKIMASAGVASVVAASIDWAKFSGAYPGIGARPIFERVAGERVAHRAPAGPGLDAAGLRALPVTQARKKLAAYVTALVGAALALPPSVVLGDQALATLGFDSLMASELRAQVQRDTGIALPLMAILENATVDGLASLLQQRIGAPPGEARASDLEREVELDPAIRAPSAAPPVARPPAVPGCALLTGATGFLGSFLLAELLEKTHGLVHCLVRAASDAEGRARIRASLEKRMLWDDAFGPRIVPVVGNLAEPRFGWREADFEELSARVDAVYHCGALVHFLMSYEDLRPTNVAGLKEVLRFASSRRIIPVHFVSSMAAFLTPHYAGTTIREEEEPAGADQPPLTGYGRTKWVGERIVTLARERGLAVSVYRPGFVGCHSRTGVFNEPDFMSLLLRACLETECAPLLEMPVSLSPVDYVAGAIVHLSTRAHEQGKNFHLSHTAPTTWNEVVASLERLGLVRPLPLPEWLLATRGPRSGSSSHALRLLGPFFDDPAFLQSLRYASFDTRATQQSLSGSNVSCARLDANFWRVLCRRMLPGTGDRDVPIPRAS